MNRSLILSWVLSVGASLRKSQAKTLAQLVCAAVPTQRATLANIGRAMTGTARCKHKIKRAGRFIANKRVTVADAMTGVIARLARRKDTPLVVALDWVEVRALHTLVAAAVVEGRSVPLLWHSYPEWELSKSQNNLEEGLIRLLRSLVPDRVRIILLADRGFGRTELARTLLGLVNVSFVLRIKPQVKVQHPKFTGTLVDYPVKKGMRRVLRGAKFRTTDPVNVNVVIRWKKGLPEHRDGPWFLVTDLSKGCAIELSALYGKRMGVEEFFRDAKSLRNGSALRHTQVKKAERFDRLVLVLVLAYLLLTGLGLRAMDQYRAGEWSSTDCGKPASAVTAARAILGWFRLSPAAALNAVLAATINAAPNWG
jgi:DDE family transposase